jgi:hypothetical protein
MKRNLAWLGLLGVLTCGNFALAQEKISLAEDGRTTCLIVPPEPPTAVDVLAVKELTAALQEATGAEFKVVSPEQADSGRPRIFVGLSTPARKILGPDPLAGMDDQGHVLRSIGDDIFLYGQGTHGNLYAVYEFLEREVGCRWFSAFGKAKIPRCPSLRVPALDRRIVPAFPYRSMYTDCFLLRPEAMMFLYRNRLNLSAARHMETHPGVVDALPMIGPGVHTLFSYLPPREKPVHGINPPLEFLENKNYFRTNPEFFSLDASGRRTEALQLCFSNRELRRTFTENVLETIKRHGGKGIVTVDANDRPGHFCYCPECRKLEDRYASIGGPLYDYLLELSAVLQKRYPGTFVKFLAYRKEQSQKPPRIARLPDNLIVVFAPIDDNFAADWQHPSNRETYHDLERWCEIAEHVWVWYYPNPYVGNLPFGNIQRLVRDIELMHRAGVNGMFFEHDVGVTEGSGFSELQTYLMLKLWQSPCQDVDELTREFLEFQYGRAAPLMGRYLDELEQCRKEMTVSIPWNPSYAMFRYLTADNLYRWQKDFDRMEEQTADAPAQRFNVQMVRFNLDMAVLQKWPEAKKRHPDYFTATAPVAERIRAAYARAVRERCSPALQGVMQARQKSLEENLSSILLFAENPGKPLPEPLAGIASERVRRTVPRHGQNGRIKDSEAAFGVAGEEAWAGKSFQIGFYDQYNKKIVLQRELPLADIKPNVYQLHKLGRVELTPDCLVWMGTSWLLSAKLDEFYEPGVNNQWDVYVSLNFAGPSFSPDAKLAADRVRSDQIVLVKAEPDTKPVAMVGGGLYGKFDSERFVHRILADGKYPGLAERITPPSQEQADRERLPSLVATHSPPASCRWRRWRKTSALKGGIGKPGATPSLLHTSGDPTRLARVVKGIVRLNNLA